MKRDALILLLLAYRHVAYYAWPEGQQWYVFNAAGAVCIIALILLVRPWWPLIVWVVSEELMVATCSGWAVVYPITGVTDELCSQRLGFQVGLIGMLGLATLSWRMTVTTLTGPK